MLSGERVYVIWTVFVKITGSVQHFLDQNEQISEEKNILFMLEKCRTHSIQTLWKIFNSRITTDQECSITLASAENHLAASVFELSEFSAKNHTISGVKSYEKNEGNLWMVASKLMVKYKLYNAIILEYFHMPIKAK